MTKTAETVQPRAKAQKVRNIVIVEDPKAGYNPLRRSADVALGHLDVFSLFGHKDLRETTIPRSPHSALHKITGIVRPTITPDEKNRITDAMEEMAFTGPQGTDLKYKNFYVYQEKGNSEKTKRRKIKRKSFGWQNGGGFYGGYTSVAAEHEWRVKPAVKELKARHKSGHDPIGEALAREEQEFNQLARIDSSEKIKWYYRPQIAVVAAMSDKSPKKVGKETEFGKTRNDVREYWKNMMLHIGDEQLDPHDMIHGPFEGVIKTLQKIQNSPGGPIASLLLGKWENEVSIAINAVTQINRQMSRDAERTTKSRVRNVLVMTAYGGFRAWATAEDPGSQKKSLRASIAGIILPSDVLVEMGIDRRVNQQELARKADGFDLLANRSFEEEWSKKQQLMFAEEFLAMYDVVDKRDQIPHQMWEKVSAVVSPIIDHIPGLDGSSFEKKFRSLVNIYDDDDTREIKNVVDEAKQAYAGEPRSTRQQVDALLAYADKVLASGLLNHEETFRWERARDYAQQFDQAAKNAQEIVDSHAASQE